MYSEVEVETRNHILKRRRSINVKIPLFRKQFTKIKNLHKLRLLTFLQLGEGRVHKRL